MAQANVRATKPMGEHQDRNLNEDAAAEESDQQREAEQADEALQSQVDSDHEERVREPGPEEEIARLREALLRTRAEMDNLQKRAEREIEKSRRFAVDSLLRDLVPVIDSLDQGLDSAGDDTSLSEGLSLTRRQLLKALTRFGLEEEDPTGKPFDPQWHEAMSMQASDEHAADTVIAVLQKGYRLHDRLLRPARVIVARAPDQ